MKTKIKKSSNLAAGFLPALIIQLAVLSAALDAFAAENETSNKILSFTLDLGDRKIVLYQPEVDTDNGGSITARSAMSVTLTGKAPYFGAARFSARATTTKKDVLLSNLVVDDVTVPSDKEDPGRLKNAMNRSLEGAEWHLPADRFSSRFAPGADGSAADDFNVAPPVIYYEERPAVLVSVDGDPILKASSDPSLKTVVNSAYFIVYDTNDKAYFLKGGKWWYRTTNLKGEWIVTAPPKASIRRLADEAFRGSGTEQDKEIAALKDPPKIILSTVPAELVVVDGAPDYVSIDGTSLLYIDNTESNVLVDVNSQKFYILIAGRWYASASIKGPWAFVPADRLPPDFSKIPDGSNASDVLVSVPGTVPAEDAALEATVPEVATVKRSGVTTTAKYDGAPEFQLIAGTKVSYAVNSNIVVLSINGLYYAVDNGIWFVASSATGPWVVATAVPSEVQDIPPSAPVYQVRYVYVYDYTPDVVYVGYTPGYYCSYVYHGVVVYGTGWYYRPWWGTVYYPHPVTFGFGVHYNPYTGFWGYPVGVSFGWIGFSWFVSPFGFWGPAGYVYGYRHGYHHHAAHGFYHGYHHGYRAGYAAGRHAGYRASAGGRPVLYHNAYAKRGVSVRSVSPTRNKLVSTRSKIPRPSSKSFGNLRRPGERRSGDAWRNAKKGQRPSSSDAMRRPTRPSNGGFGKGRQTAPTVNRSTGNRNSFGQSKGNMFHNTQKPSAKRPQSSGFTRPVQTTRSAPSKPAPTKKSYHVDRPTTKPSSGKKSGGSSSPFHNYRTNSRPAPSRSAPSHPAPSRSGGSRYRAPSGGGHHRHH